MRVERWARTAASYLPETMTSTARRVAPPAPWRARRPHRPDDLALRDFRRPNPVVVHAGIEIEASAASLLRLVGQAQIHAFEPNRRLHDQLGRQGITAHGELLAANPGTVELSIPRYGSTWFDTDASLDHMEAATFLGERRFANYRPGRAQVDTLIVSAAALDSYALAPDIVILDHRRGAPEAVRGAIETVVRHQPLIRIDGPEPLNLGVADYLPARYDPGADCLVLEQPGVLSTWWVHPHHRSIIGVPIV